MPQVWAPLKPGDTVLIDQDDAQAGFTEYLLKRCKEEMPEENWLPLEAHTNLYFVSHYPERLHERIYAISFAPGFFLNLPLIDGFPEALAAMRDRGLKPKTCTSLIPGHQTCVQEKIEWTRRNVSHDFARVMHIGKDKTGVRGRILIDNRPHIIGDFVPEWEHVLYDQPHNRHVTDRRRLTWQNWKEVLVV